MYHSFTYNVGDQSPIVYRDLAAALSSAHFAGDKVRVNMEQTVVTEFLTSHELIGDILRNHADAYKLIKVDQDDDDWGVKKVVVCPRMHVNEVIDWVIKNLSMIKEMRYTFNRATKANKYIIGCDFDDEYAPICYYLEEI